MENGIHETEKAHGYSNKHTQKNHTYTAEFMYKSFNSLFNSWLVFSRSNNAYINIFQTINTSNSYSVIETNKQLQKQQ